MVISYHIKVKHSELGESQDCPHLKEYRQQLQTTERGQGG